MEIFFTSESLRILLTLLMAFLICFFSVPMVVKAAREKKLVDEPTERGSHSRSVPTLGGVAIFASLMISSLIFLNIYKFPGLQYTIVGLIIIFMLGIKDDLLVLSPWKKLVGQLVAAYLVIDFGNTGFTNLHGFAGIHELPSNATLVLSMFVMVVIINAFNLIDGIDGLAAGTGILSSLTFGVWFYMSQTYEMAVISFAMAGSLIAFFIYNVFGHHNKIFMGDTGSLMLGFLMSVLVIQFNEININVMIPHAVKSAPAVSVAILAIPLFDTLRVFTIRVMHRQSPFRADRRHLHHRLLDLGLNHLQATGVLVAANGLFIAAAFVLQAVLSNVILVVFVLFAMAVGLSIIPTWIYRRRLNRATLPPMPEANPILTQKAEPVSVN